MVEGKLSSDNQAFANFPNESTADLLLTYLLTSLLTPRHTVLLEKLVGSKLVKTFPTFYGTQRFITAFTSAQHLSLS